MLCLHSAVVILMMFTSARSHAFKHPSEPSAAQVVGQRNAAAPQLFRDREFNFEKLGIGGLDLQFEQIFRRAFASRVFPPEMVRRIVLLPSS